MKRKYRQAAQRLSKQTVAEKHVDPLAQLCNEKIQLLKKSKLIAKNKQKIKQNKLDNKDKKSKHQDLLLKYLPHEQDEFGQNQNIKNQLTNYNQQLLHSTEEINTSQMKKKDKVKIQYETNQKTLEVSNCNNVKSLSDLDLQAIKEKLGIGVKLDQAKIETEQNQLKQETQDLLPFAGRAFEQAPPQPAPKKIYEYPPTCKIAVIYQWPPPQSPYRQWKIQMRESRKLT